MAAEAPVFTFREEGRDEIHSFVGVAVGGVKAGQLCFRRGEWERLREVLYNADPAKVRVVEYEPWPGE